MLYAMLQQVLKLLGKILLQQAKILAGQKALLQSQKTIVAGQQAILNAIAAEDEVLQKILAEVSPPLPGPLVAIQIEYGTPEAQS